MEIRIADEADKKLVFGLRLEVFVDEQNVPPEMELDEEDSAATHIAAFQDGEIVGCCRIVFSDNSAHIGRLAVKRGFRGGGIGAQICRFAIEQCPKDTIRRIWLNAQLQAEEFYKKLGFSPLGDTFWEAGIEHIQMELLR